MAQLGMQFDANQVEPNAPFEPVLPDDYVVQIINSEMKLTKDGAGQYLELEMDILDGEFKGRKVFDRLNLINNNPKTVEIAQRTLSAICHATGVMNVTDSEQLHFHPVVVKVIVKPPQGQYSASNEVKGYKPANGGGQQPAQTAPPQARPAQQQAKPATAPQQAAKPTQQAAKPAGNTPPWRRGK
jgi:hypothetical protein